MTSRDSLISVTTVVCLAAVFCARAIAQVVPVPVPTPSPTPTYGGVYVDGNGAVQYREVNDAKLAQLRARAKNSPLKDPTLAFISLPKTTAEIQKLAAEGKAIPDELRYLGGLTQIRYVFAYPDAKDLIIAGPAEPIDSSNLLQPHGKRTGRPLMQFDDLVAALRTIQNTRGAFGCSIDPQPDAMQNAQRMVSQMGGVARSDLPAAVAQAIGPQKLSIFGAPADTRIAMACVAADYKLKRLTLGIDSSPVSGLSHAIDNSRPAGNRFWFELSYDPLLVDSEGNSFELRGSRLALKCGALSFDERGATATARTFTKQFNAKIAELCAVVPGFADLQNVGDIAVLAALIRQDRLDQKAGWDMAPLLDDSTYRLPRVPTPKSAQTLAVIRAGSVAAGGVNLAPGGVVGANARQLDEKGTLASPRQQGRSGR